MYLVTMLKKSVTPQAIDCFLSFFTLQRGGRYCKCDLEALFISNIMLPRLVTPFPIFQQYVFQGASVGQLFLLNQNDEGTVRTSFKAVHCTPSLIY